jgi:hypothetical protein
MNAEWESVLNDTVVTHVNAFSRNLLQKSRKSRKSLA